MVELYTTSLTDADCRNVFALVTKKMNEEERRYAFTLVDETVNKIDFLTTLSKTICNSTCRADYVSIHLSSSQLASFFFNHGLSHHLGSPVWLCIFFLRFRCPLLLFPGMSTSSILLTVCSSSILLTWPYHFSRFSVIVFDACTTLVVPLMCSLRILSLLVTPHIHLSILISFTSSRASCPLVVAQVSAPYNRAGLTTVL